MAYGTTTLFQKGLYFFKRPQAVKSQQTINDFRSQLETHLFSEFNPRYRQIHSGSDDHLKWLSSVIGSYPQWQVKEPQGR